MLFDDLRFSYGVLQRGFRYGPGLCARQVFTLGKGAGLNNVRATNRQGFICMLSRCLNAGRAFHSACLRSSWGAAC